VADGQLPFVLDERAFSVDRLNRLTDTTYTSTSETEFATLDLVGNRESHAPRGGSPTAYALANAANEYATIGGTGVIYDAAGNLIVDEAGREYFYDEHNRPTRITSSGGATVLANYAYDALGRRVLFEDPVAGITTRYYYDGPTVIEERDGACPGPNCDVRVRYHVGGGQYVDEHVATFDDASAAFAYYVHNDLFSVAAVADPSGRVIDSYDYGSYGLSAITPSVGCTPGDFTGDGLVASDDVGPFTVVVLNGTGTPEEICAADINGDGLVNGLDISPFTKCVSGSFCPPPVIAIPSPVHTPYTLHGRPVDVIDNGNLMLQYNRARYYDIKNGRWLQRDPVGYHDRANLYNAFGDNPAYFLDPSGLWLARRIAEIINENGRLSVGDIKMLGEELQKFPNQLAALTDEEIQLLGIIGGAQYGTPWTDATLSPALRAEADERFPNLQPMWRYRIQANLSTRRRMLFILLLQDNAFANYVTELYRVSRDLNPVHFAAERGIQIGTGTETITGQKVSRLQAGVEFVVYLALVKGAQVGPKAITRAAGGEVPGATVVPPSGRADTLNRGTIRFSQTTAGGRGRAPALRASLRESGFTDPIDVVEVTGQVPKLL